MDHPHERTTDEDFDMSEHAEPLSDEELRVWGTPGFVPAQSETPRLIATIDADREELRETEAERDDLLDRLIDPQLHGDTLAMPSNEYFAIECL